MSWWPCVYVVLLISLIHGIQAQGDCPSLQVSAATILDPSSDTFAIGRTVNVTCAAGHAFNQQTHEDKPYVILTCLSNGWNTTQTPSCAEIYIPAREGPQCSMLPDSGIPSAVGNRTLVFGNGTEYGTIYRYYCYTGYLLTPPTPFTQCKGSTWSSLPDNLSQPTCQKVRCTLPVVPSILTLVPGPTPSSPVTYIEYGMSVTVSCRTGYSVLGDQVINCTTDGSLSATPACQDVDECTDSPPCDQLCYNTRGSYRCDCNQGYSLSQGLNTCQDDDECLLFPTLCPNGACVNLVGGYLCTCDSDQGYVLYTVDGDEGFDIPQSETLFDSINNTYRINHTCVLRQCEFSNTFPNGDLLRYQARYHVGDILEFDCQLGYTLSGAALIQCQTDGTWSADVPVCQAVFCSLPQGNNPPTYLNSSTEVVLPSDAQIPYGDTVIVSCETYGQTDMTSLRCFYDRENDEYLILSTTCVAVTCPPASGVNVGSGHLELVQGISNELGAVYDIVCENGAVFIGNSTYTTPTRTICDLDGKWLLGTAYCLGQQCSDPGTPYGGTQVVDGDYTLGSTLYYSCETPGYVPHPNLTYTCTLVGNSAVWVNPNSTTVRCVDAEPPVLECPPDQRVVIGTWLMDNVPPTVMDNSGGLVHLFYNIEPANQIIQEEPSPYPLYRIVEDVIVTISADTLNDVDKIAPPGSCTFNVTVEDLQCDREVVLRLFEVTGFTPCSSQACNISCNDGYIFWNGEGVTTQSQNLDCEYDGHTQPQFPFTGVCAERDVSSVVTLFFNVRVVLFFTNVTLSCVTDFLNSIIPNNQPCFDNSQVMVESDTSSTITDGYEIRYNVSITEQDNKVTKVRACQETLQAAVDSFDLTTSVEITDCGSFSLSAFTINFQPIRSACPNGQVDFQGNCYPCLPGTFLNDSGVPFCEFCPPDQYSETIEASECMTCSTGRVPLLIAGRSEQDCVSCPDICLNGGTCTEPSFTCSCPQSYSGKFCQNRADPCGSNPCRAGGMCNVAQDVFVCSCADGYSGDMCEDHAFCASMDCGTNGVCVETDTGAICRCRDGTSGDRCEVVSDPCTLQLCGQNTEECVLQGDYRRTCTCTPGWTGEDCDVNIDECVSLPCVNGGTCEDEVDGYACMCEAGYEGTDCSFPNSCLPPVPSSCPRCVEDYRQGSRICVCPDGYDTTADAEGASMCDVQTPCSEDPPVCLNGGSCTPQGAVPGEFSCSCTAGWQGERCQISVNECSSNPCGEGGTCIDQHNAYSCQCLDAVSDDEFYFGASCVAGCDADPCDAVGTVVSGCSSLLNDYICTCDVGYTGKNCEVDIDYCEKGPCRNGGSCMDSTTSYTCVCTAGWTGEQCEQLLPMFTETTCQQQAPCYNLLDNYFCVCENLLYEVCDVRFTPCDDPNTCYNQGICADRDAANDVFSCGCPTGFTGDLCFLRSDLCRRHCQMGNRKCPSNPPLVGEVLCDQPEDPVQLTFSYIEPFTRWTNTSISLPCSPDCVKIQSDLAKEFETVQFLGTAPSVDRETARNISYVLSVAGYTDQLPHVQDVISRWALDTANVPLFETRYGDVTPVQGPQAGGTLLTIRGFNLPLDVVPFIGSYMCLPTQRNVLFVTCSSASVSLEADIDVGLKVQVNSGGSLMNTTGSFIYRGNPVISLVQPLQGLESGGITITVEGTNVEFIHTAVLLTTVVEIDTGLSRTYTTYCDVGEEIACDTANITGFKESVRQKRDLRWYHERQRRQATPALTSVNEEDGLIIYIGLELDGVPDFTNLTANPNTTQFGEVEVYRDPEIFGFDGGVLVFRSTWPIKDTQIQIEGKGLAPGTLKTTEINIRVGVAECKVEADGHFDNLLICNPPLTRPEVSPGVLSSNGRIPVTVNIGDNLDFDVGNMMYIQNPWEYLPFRYGIIAAILGLVVIVIAVLIYIFRFRRPRLFRQWRDYHSLPRSDYVGPGVRYDGSSHHSQHHTISDRLTRRSHMSSNNSYLTPGQSV